MSTPDFEKRMAARRARERAGFISGIHRFATWLEQHPDVEAPRDKRLLLACHTNDAVAAFATEHGISPDLVRYDEEGNASLDLEFGPVSYHVYGYRDFEQHCEDAAARQAQRYARSHGLSLVPDDSGREPERRAA